MTVGPTTEQLLVQVALRALDELLVVLAPKAPESADRTRAEEALQLALTQLWSRVPGLELRCMSDGLWWDGAHVLSDGETESVLLPTLASAGIQSLTLEPGAERGDAVRFAQLVDEKVHGDEAGTSDLVMMLFRADLTHVRTSVRPPDLPTEPSTPPGAPGAEVVTTGEDPTATDADPPPPGADPARSATPGSADPGNLREAIRADARTSARTQAGVVDLESFDSTLYFLDDKEIEYLRFQVEKQYSVDQTRSALGLLLDTLELRSDPATREEVIEALRAFLPYLLGTGRYTPLAYLTEQLRTVLKTVELESGHRAALEEILRSLSQKGALTQMFLTLEDGTVTPSPASLEALVSQLGRDALETVLVWSGQLRRAEAKSALLDALEAVFRRNPAHLATIVASRSRAVVQSGLSMAARLRAEELVDGVSLALEHDDPGIRKQAVELLGTIPGTPAMRGVARVLDDPDAEVRKAAYRVFLGRPYRSAAKPLRTILSSRDLETLGLSERKLLFSAYGAAASSSDVDELSKLLAGKPSFGQRPSSETRACGVLALERIGTPAARAALEEASRYSDPLVRSAARTALRREP